MRLQGKTAIVTGGGSGFGEGIAKTFAREGANVVVNDLNGASAERVASEIAVSGGKAIAVAGDVTKQADWKTLFDAAIEDFGSIQVVVNNAGTTHRNKPVMEVTEAEFDRVYAVNVKSIYHSVTQFVPYFRSVGGGSFINVASTAGVRPRPGLVWYNGSKAAVIIASKALAVELGPDRIRVNCINPVMGETGLLSEFMGVEDTPANRQKFLSSIPLGRLSTPQDIANAALYLASDDAEFITGVALEVDGGRCV
ncbi:MAG: SDR family oxidoreductase [Pseudomonadota bacterium]|jgi:3-oxoacyl-[acyl-carrier protein] reductase|uniref:Toluenesulfonate zinc-independent alcohol dehydrogenase n=1 Tax=Caballeronia sordidicola TaxID=196367 RepID=A0A242N728_CABSO|nr:MULTISPECIES: SDR family oxidoreductase [Burkholderiaceae]AME22731.1 3-ketoacyl-ACP reductase [Burkholderia sp. PAMC 26561]MDP9156733.1 SDR family oxidoreductase [Pseudomonadota bacterium]OTP73734.1 toluenesulfonate zinc-independent alcohol dehydrogenase [Caballeronia sordidicola]OTP79214.1 toluenesulfonate zinc-independent alcohol dehydrogenase [Caballeronia sordidicola]